MGITNGYSCRKSLRLKEYDYSKAGYYFITTCTKDRKNWFGKITNGKIVINKYGKIVIQQWVWLSNQYNYVKLDNFIVMPNHFHGIIIIESNAVGNGRDRSLQKVKSLSSLMGAFKTTSSKLIHNAGLYIFQWQKSFYEHIIWYDEELNDIREYIINNPLQWELDIENPDKKQDYKNFADYLKKHLLKTDGRKIRPYEKNLTAK